MRLRFAPSPTGNLHIGTLRTALFNWVFAQKHQATLVLRIEDTDLERSHAEFEGSILEGLAWMGITLDEGPVQGGPYGPYRQSERIQLGIYQTYAQKLVDEKKAYPCFCTDSDLDSERQLAQTQKVPYVYSRKCMHLSEAEILEKKAAQVPATIRFKIPHAQTLTFRDLIREEISFDMALISDFVLVKSDGTPSYNFAVVVDDMLMEITHVIRGEDHISNTPRQIVLYQALGATHPQFAHLPMILGPDKSKLSKRHGATSVIEYQSNGYLNTALRNYLMLLGWSSPDGKELLDIHTICDNFSLDRLSKSGAVFDVTKLKWMNGQYIRALENEALYAALFPYVSEELRSAKKLKDMMVSVKDNLDLLTDISLYLPVYFNSPESFKEAVSAFAFSEADKDVLIAFKNALVSFQGEELTAEAVDVILQTLLVTTGLGKGKVFKPIRLACSASATGPHLPDFVSIMGKDRIVERVSWVL